VAEDLSGVVASLTRAFEDDPLSKYLFPNDKSRARGLARFFRAQIRHTYLYRGEPYTTGKNEAAALWMPPERKPPRLREVVAQVSVAPTMGRRIGAAFSLIQSMEARHPKAPHYYLGTIGTDPSFQGRGFGTALLAPVLRRCDEEGIPAYLESSKERNVPFYRRHGFEVTGELTTPGGEVKLWLMWRDPVPPPPDSLLRGPGLPE